MDVDRESSQRFLDVKTKEFQSRELLGEEILVHKQEIIAYDRKRNANREALGTFRRGELGESGDKVWLCLGDNFVRMKQSQVENLLKEEQVSLDAEVNRLRDGLKKKMDALAELEGREKPTDRGFGLKGM
eukprot:Nk52_evm11s2209 gene=Nk52_evmTU11s2209